MDKLGFGLLGRQFLAPGCPVYAPSGVRPPTWNVGRAILQLNPGQRSKRGQDRSEPNLRASSNDGDPAGKIKQVRPRTTVRNGLVANNQQTVARITA